MSRPSQNFNYNLPTSFVCALDRCYSQCGVSCEGRCGILPTLSLRKLTRKDATPQEELHAQAKKAKRKMLSTDGVDFTLIGGVKTKTARGLFYQYPSYDSDWEELPLEEKIKQKDIELCESAKRNLEERIKFNKLHKQYTEELHTRYLRESARKDFDDKWTEKFFD